MRQTQRSIALRDVRLKPGVGGFFADYKLASSGANSRLLLGTRYLLGDGRDAAIEGSRGKIGAARGFAFSPALRDRNQLRDGHIDHRNDSIVGRNDSQVPLVAARIRRNMQEAEQAPKLSASNFVRLEADEFASGRREFHLGVRRQN